MRAAIIVVALSVGATLASGPAPPRFAPTIRSFSGTTVASSYVTMDDGVRLAVDVHLPKGLAPGERTATILHMTRYYRSVTLRQPTRLFYGEIYPITERDIRDDLVKAGYSWVDADVRGAGASFGYFDDPLSPREMRDGSELLDWIVAQPWSAGIIGTTGESYDGALATKLAGEGHAAIKAVVPRFSGWDAYGDLFLPGGLPSSLIREWSQLLASLDHDRLSDIMGWTTGLVSSGVHAVDPRLLPQAIAEHARNVDLVALFSRIEFRDDQSPPGSGATVDSFSPHTQGERPADEPVYAYAGWFDGALARSAVHQFLSSRNAGSRLRLGPWFHGGEFNASPYANGRNNNFDHAREVMRFFDYHLRGKDAGVSADAPVQYFTMGEERWKTAAVWPPPGEVQQEFFLAPERTLSRQPPTAASASDRYVVDATATTGPGSRWGLVVGTNHTRGYKDRQEADRRLLTYTTPPLADDVEVTGHPVVHLSLSANVTDGAVFAYLEDVEPDGHVRYVTEGQLRLADRKLGSPPGAGDPVPFHSFLRSDARPLVPEEVVEAVFDLLPTSFLFRAGHAVRLAIAGADAGSFDVPLPGSAPVYEMHRDAAHASRLDLPTHPAAAR